MKALYNLNYLFLAVLGLFLASCEKEAVLPDKQAVILEITFSETSSVSTAQEISITIDKPTPCHNITEVKKSVSDKTYSYDIIVVNGAEMCIQVIEEETVNVTFDPATSGEYTLRFLVNGKLHETRTVTVTN